MRKRYWGIIWAVQILAAFAHGEELTLEQLKEKATALKAELAQVEQQIEAQEKKEVVTEVQKDSFLDLSGFCLSLERPVAQLGALETSAQRGLLADKVRERIEAALEGRSTVLRLRITQVSFGNGVARIYYEKKSALAYFGRKSQKIGVVMAYHFDLVMTQEQAARIRKDQAMVLRGAIRYRSPTSTSSTTGAIVSGLATVVKPQKDSYLLEFKVPSSYGGARLGSIYLADPVAMIGGVNFQLK